MRSMGGACRFPGGVPLEWLGWAFASLIVVLVLSQRSIAFAASRCARWPVGRRLARVEGSGDRRARRVCRDARGGCGLDWLDWPLRLLIAPGMVATLAGQSSPDGRPAHHYLTSFVGLQLRAARRSLDGAIPGEGEVHVWARRFGSPRTSTRPCFTTAGYVARRGLVFAHPVLAVPGRGRLIVRRAEGRRVRRGERLAEVIELGDGQVVEVRP